jgi:hypothetical protein
MAMPDLSDEVLLGLGIVLGIATLSSGLVVRGGRLRYQLANYFDSTESLWLRRLPLVEIPAGFALIFSCAGTILLRTTSPAWDVGMVVFGVGLLSAAVTIAWLARPPMFIKPGWLAQQERHTTLHESRTEEILWGMLAVGLSSTTGLIGAVALLIGLNGLFSLL